MRSKRLTRGISAFLAALMISCTGLPAVTTVSTVAYAAETSTRAVASGLTLQGTDWVYLKNGSIDTTYTGLAQSPVNGSWYYVTKGHLDWNYSGLGQSPVNGLWYYVSKGKLDWSYTGLGQSPLNGNWYYVKNGKLDWSYTGVGKSPVNGNYYYVKAGKLDWSYSGYITQGSSCYKIVKGKATLHEHEYVFTDIVLPTCTTGGVVTYTCFECGDTLDITSQPMGHEYYEKSSTANPADGGKTHIVTYKCHYCEDSYTKVQ